MNDDPRDPMREQRERMIAEQVVARGVRSPRVLAALRAVRREGYVEPRLAPFAYDDGPLPIAQGQTISQPYIVALMAEAMELRDHERVLEIGTGSGYAAAVLSHLAGEVFGIERHAELCALARARLARDGCTNVHVCHGDGTLGWPAYAPFAAIAVAAAAPRVPDALRRQLALGGHLVIPIGPVGDQHLLRITRTGRDRFRTEQLTPVRFVPLIGARDDAAPPRE